jgi:hypothetical protein
MVFDLLAVAHLAGTVGMLLVLPGLGYVLWIFPDRTYLEAAAAGYGIMVSALVGALFVLNYGMDVAFTRSMVYAAYGALVLPLTWRVARVLSSGTEPFTARPAWISPARTRILGSLVLLALVAGLAGYWAGFSNLVTAYPYLHHVDGSIHFGNARAMMDHGGFPYDHWLSGGGSQGPSDETGFWYLLAALSWLGGQSLTQVAFHGKLVLVPVLAMAAWAYGSRDGTPYGLEAALLVPLIPSTHRFLGPAFLVPMTVVLTLGLAGGILSRSRYRGRALAAGLVLGGGGLAIHSATAGLVALLVGWGLLLRVGGRREALVGFGLAAAFAIGFLALVTRVPHLSRYWWTMIDAWRTPQTVTKWGLSGGGAAYLQDQLTRWVTGLFGLGVVAAFRGRRSSAQALVLSIPPIVAIMVAYQRWTRGFSSLYDRTFFYLGFLFLMVAGVGLAETRRVVVEGLTRACRSTRRWFVARAARRLRRRRPGSRWWARAAAVAMAPTVVAAATGMVGLSVTAAGTGGVYSQVDDIKRGTFYHTFPENETIEKFLWIRGNMGEMGGARLGLVHPGAGNEFAAITGLYAYSHTSHPYLRVDAAPTIFRFLDDGCRPFDFLNETGAEVVVGPCRQGPGYLETVHQGIHLYRPALRSS